MITREELIKIGRFNKPHGVKGELSFTFTDDVFDRTECPYIVCEIDGIFVPFFIEEYRFKSDTTALIKLEDVDNGNPEAMWNVFLKIKNQGKEYYSEKCIGWVRKQFDKNKNYQKYIDLYMSILN